MSIISESHTHKVATPRGQEAPPVYRFPERTLAPRRKLPLALQVLVVHWPPAQSVFSTTALEPDDWLTAVAVASCVLLLDELRKYMVSLARKF